MTINGDIGFYVSPPLKKNGMNGCNIITFFVNFYIFVRFIDKFKSA